MPIPHQPIKHGGMYLYISLKHIVEQFLYILVIDKNFEVYAKEKLKIIKLLAKIL